MAIPTLTMIPSGYKAGKLYSVLPTNGDGDFTTTRSTTANRVNKSGLIETMASGISRLNYPLVNGVVGDCPSLLLERSSTNLQLRSEEFENSLYFKNSVVVVSNATVSPNGDVSSDKITRTSTSAGNILSIISKSTSAIEYTSSIFVKQGEGDYLTIQLQGNYGDRIDIRFRFSTKEFYETTEFGSAILRSTKVEEYPNGWLRLSYSYLSDTASSVRNYYSPRSSNGNISSTNPTSTSFVYLWGAMVEENTYPTSYIPTTTSSVTRLNDFIDGAGSNSLFNSLESTFFVEMASFLNQQTSSNGIELSDISGQNRITLQYDTTNNQIRCDVRVLNSAQAILATTNFDITNFNKMAITYKLNEVKFYVNGQLRGTDTSVNLFAPNTLTEVRSTIAAISNVNFNLQAKIKDLRVYNTVLTQEEAIALTTL